MCRYNLSALTLISFLSFIISINLLSSERVNEDNLTLIFYNDIEIGEPKQKLIFIVSPDEYNFYIVTNKNKNSINNNSYYYDFRLSKTINIIV